MVTWNKIKDFASEAGDRLSNAWKGASAKSVTFDHFSENELAIFKPMHDSFVDKANRGYFDEDVQRDYKRFMSGWGFEKEQISGASQTLQDIAKAALPANRQLAKTVQDRYWIETGLTDTRPTGLPLIHRDY